MSIFTDYLSAMSYIKERGKLIGQDALGGNAKARSVISAYAMAQKLRGPAEDVMLIESLNEYLQKWAKSQICRICCEPLTLRWWTARNSSEGARFSFHCNHSACPLCNILFDERDYRSAPLNGYLKGKVPWKWDYDVLIERTRHLYPRGWQHQARSIRGMVRRSQAGLAIYDHDTTERAIAAVKIHKTPEGETPF